MGQICNTLIHRESAECFRAVEITGSLLIVLNRTAHFNQILLLHDDNDTLAFAERNLASLVNNAIMIKKMDFQPKTAATAAEILTDGIVPLLESIVMLPEKNMLHCLTASLKKAILSIALSRYNSNKEMICNVLGLSGSQLDDELQSSGFALIADKKKLD